MKAPFCVIVISIVFKTTNEQCPLNAGNIPITSCAGSTKYGSFTNIDFTKINRSCTCTVIPSFVGRLLVVSNAVTVQKCNTQIIVDNNIVFGCSAPTDPLIFAGIDVQINQSVVVRAEYLHESPSKSGTFYHCLGFQQNSGLQGNFSVICGSPSDAAITTVSSTTTYTATLTSTRMSYSPSTIALSTESTSVVNTNENTVTMSSNTTNVSYDSLSIESTQDDPTMLYIIAGSAGGGAILLIGLVVLISVLINRTRSARNKKGPHEADMEPTNKVFDNNSELPDNPLYLSSQPMDELGYSSDQEKQLGLTPTDSKTKKKINLDYDVPPNNKPIADGTSSMPVYAVPKKIQDRTPEVSTGDVYAEVCKPNRSTANDPVRKRNEDGLFYMEVEQDTAATKQTNTNDKNKITEGVCYAEIKHT